MRSRVTLALACGAAALVTFAGDGAKAASNAAGGSYCLSSRERGSDCGFTSLAQCQASASGTDAGCYAAPPALLQQQGASVLQAAPGGGRGGAGGGRGKGERAPTPPAVRSSPGSPPARSRAGEKPHAKSGTGQSRRFPC